MHVGPLQVHFARNTDKSKKSQHKHLQYAADKVSLTGDKTQTQQLD